MTKKSLAEVAAYLERRLDRAEDDAAKTHAEMAAFASALDMEDGRVGSAVQVSPGVVEWDRFVTGEGGLRVPKDDETGMRTERVRTTFTHEVIR